jgi:hypothetical protein
MTTQQMVLLKTALHSVALALLRLYSPPYRPLRTLTLPQIDNANSCTANAL